MKHTLLIFFALLLSFLAAAPEYGFAQINIEANLMMPPNPSPYLSDWQSNAGSIQLTANLTQPYNQPVKLAALVSLNGQPVARTKPENMPMLSLHQGLNTFNAVNIIPYQAVSFIGGIDQSAQRAGRLPEGNYEICVWFINPETGAALANSPCRPFTIRDVQPPMLISPDNGAKFGRQKLVGGEQTTLERQSGQQININDLGKLDAKSLADLKTFDLVSGNSHTIYNIDPKITDKDSAEAMQIPIMTLGNPNAGNNLISSLAKEDGISFRFQKVDPPATTGTQEAPKFSWLPPTPSPATPLQYKLRIVPVYPGQSSEGAMLSGTPVIERNLTTPFYAVEYLSDEYWKLGEAGVHFNIIQFAWGIQAFDATGKPIGRNNGWSETRTFDITGDPDFDLLRIKDTTKNNTPNSFFDVFVKIDSPVTNTNIRITPEPCGYTYKERLRTMYGPWKMTKSYSQYANTYTRIKYGVYRIFTCSLFKGHSGPHHGTAITVYVKEGEEKVTVAPPGPSNPTTVIDPPLYLTDDPAKKDQMDKKDIDKVPTKDEADKKEADEKKNNGGNNNGGNNGGQNGSNDNGSNGTGTGTNNGTGTGNGTAVGGTNTKPEPCPYEYKKYIRLLYEPCKDGWMEMYGVYEVFKCSLLKGHSGPHHGTIETVYVHDGRVGCSDNLKGESLPPGATVVTPKDLAKIPEKKAADKADVNPPVVPAKEPCPYSEKKLLRTVIGSWKRGATTVRHISYHGTTVAWADVTWTRDVWNVFSVAHCTLDKGHAGAHKLGAAKEEFVKYSTITEKVTYGVGVPQVPPSPHWSDSLPHEDPH